jgi:hypothetical protein
MPRRIVVLLVVLVAFLAIILVVTLRRQPPDIPADADHLDAHRTAARCLECHGPGQKNARPPNHPLGNDCWQCHFEVGEAR